tara:strand:- start:209 stop:1057 length:849 start_codon:yes stop_codon:yes gene_type:complete
MSFTLNPLSEALGAEIVGLDLSRPLDKPTFDAVHQAHLDYLVLVFREQDLTPAQHIAFSERFGPLDIHPADDAVLTEHPEILLVSTRRENGRYIGLPDGGPKWHSDISYREKPSLGSMLYGIEIPEEGGNTGFANMYKAYETLPADLAEAIEGKRGVFLAGRNNAKQTFRRTLNEAQKAKTPPVSHPIIRTHPETGRKSVFANEQHTIAIEGLPEDDSNAILSELFAHCARPEFAYFHDWRPADLTFWDNRCALHIADLTRLDDPAYLRHMHRTTIQGDAPF